jgi:hypothetical protein
MNPADRLAVENLRGLIAIHRVEEERLLSVVSGRVPTEVRLIALFDLEKLRETIRAMTEELARLETLE